MKRYALIVMLLIFGCSLGVWADDTEIYGVVNAIWVRLKGLDENLAVLEVEDDGVGFNVGSLSSSYDQRGSLGMLNMRERAELVNGVIRIDSAEGKGTSIQVLIPLSEEGADRLRRGQ